jgi:two-component system, OmpR family, sensor histidine kinase BaeS
MRNIIHEVKNHLAVAVANIEAFRDGVFEPSPARLEAVLQALAEVDVLLGQLPRDSSTATLATSMNPMDVCAVITNEVLALEASAQQHGIAFQVHQCESTGEACQRFGGDPLRVAEIVNNVVFNAIRYTPAGGRVEVDCRRADGTLMLTVSDTGPGIAEADRERIFDAGYRGGASEGTSGSGLGLALARRFAEEHGGSIEVLNTTSAGTQFVVKLPGTEKIAVSSVCADGSISLL